jgi:hypothetical protein
MDDLMECFTHASSDSYQNLKFAMHRLDMFKGYKMFKSLNVQMFKSLNVQIVKSLNCQIPKK